MGCGHSKKLQLYPRKNKNKSNGKKGHDDTEEEDEEEHAEGRMENSHQKEKEKIDDDLQLSDSSSPEPNSNEVIIPILKKNGPMLGHDISSSQQNFFRMLDQKIESGPDYDSSDETERQLEEQRQIQLVHHWESASLSASMCSSTSRSLQNTPVRQVPLNNRQSQIRSQFQQPLSVDLLSQQQKMISQLKQHQANQSPGIAMNSPKRVELNPSNRQQLLSQTIIHQTYVQPQPTLPQAHIIAQFQNQAATNLQLRQLSASSVIPSNYSPPIPGTIAPNMNRNLACMQMSQVNYNFSQQQQPPLYGDMSQVQQPVEPRFPPAISVNRLAPQLQRQLRETQELIKDCSPTLYGNFVPQTQTSSNATQIQIRSQANRTGYSDLS